MSNRAVHSARRRLAGKFRQRGRTGLHDQSVCDDETQRKIVANLLSLANDFDAALILEGIETESTARAAAGLGIPFGQGFFFGYPEDVSKFV